MGPSHIRHERVGFHVIITLRRTLIIKAVPVDVESSRRGNSSEGRNENKGKRMVKMTFFLFHPFPSCVELDRRRNRLVDTLQSPSLELKSISLYPALRIKIRDVRLEFITSFDS